MPKRVVKCICSSSTSNLPKNNLQTNHSQTNPKIFLQFFASKRLRRRQNFAKKRFVFLPENPKTFFETAASLQRKSHEHSSLLLMYIGRPNRKGNAVSRNSTRINTKYCQFTLPSRELQILSKRGLLMMMMIKIKIVLIITGPFKSFLHIISSTIPKGTQHVQITIRLAAVFQSIFPVNLPPSY